MPGVVVLPTGAWYDPAEPGVPGTLELHGTPTVLTLDKGSSKLAQAPVAHSCLVEVERFAGEAPRVAAFDPPRFAAARAGRGADGPAPRRRPAGSPRRRRGRAAGSGGGSSARAPAAARRERLAEGEVALQGGGRG